MSKKNSAKLSLLSVLNPSDELPEANASAGARGGDRSSTSAVIEPVSEIEGSECQPGTGKAIGPIPAVMSLLNSLLGAGILSVPNSFTSEGIIPSLILMLLMWGLSFIAAILVIGLRDKTGATGLPDLALKILGKRGEFILAVLTIMFITAAQVSYLILGGDMLASWFTLGGVNVTSIGNRALMMFVYVLGLPVALTIPRDVRFLSYFGAVSVASIIFFDLSIFIKGCIQFADRGAAPVIVARVDINMFSALSIYALTFALPVVCLPCLALYRPETKARYKVSLWAMILCLVLVVWPGIFGYLQFGDDTKPNIMQNYSDGDKLMFVLRIAFFLVVSLAYPAICQTPMVCWGNLVFKDGLVKEMVWKKRVIVLILTHTIPLIVSMFLANVKPALSIGGALGGCIVDFIFPSVMWIFYNKELEWYHPKKILLWLFAAFGAIAAAISTYTAIVDAINTFGA